MANTKVMSGNGDPFVLRVPDVDRIKNARKKRHQQLKRWLQYDKSLERDLQRREKRGPPPLSSDGQEAVPRVVHFSPSQVLLEAAARGDLDEVQGLLNDGVCPNAANTDGLTALHQCCIDNNLEMCRLLLRFGADVNARDTELWTPLHAAGTCCHSELCKLLIQNGADLMAVNTDGNMPYDICDDNLTLDLIEGEMASRGITQEDIDEHRKSLERMMLSGMETLVKSGANINELDEQGAAPLHVAAACGYLDVASFLLQHGALLDLLDAEGWRAIHIAACWGQLEVIEMLLNFGVNIDALTSAGETIFEVCHDEQLHSRLVDLKFEAERRQLQHQQQQQQQLQTSNPPSLTRNAVGRRSSNPRSASIRRSSMREKNKLSWKEAKQEAEMYGLPLPSEDEGHLKPSKAPAWMVESETGTPLSLSEDTTSPTSSSHQVMVDSSSRLKGLMDKSTLNSPPTRLSPSTPKAPDLENPPLRPMPTPSAADTAVVAGPNLSCLKSRCDASHMELFDPGPAAVSLSLHNAYCTPPAVRAAGAPALRPDLEGSPYPASSRAQHRNPISGHPAYDTFDQLGGKCCLIM